MLNKMSDNFEWFVSPFASSNDIGHGAKLFRKILLRFSCLLFTSNNFSSQRIRFRIRCCVFVQTKNIINGGLKMKFINVFATFSVRLLIALPKIRLPKD